MLLKMRQDNEPLPSESIVGPDGNRIRNDAGSEMTPAGVSVENAYGKPIGSPVIIPGHEHFIRTIMNLTDVHPSCMDDTDPRLSGFHRK